MEMKKLFSLALLVSAFAITPVFGVDPDPAPVDNNPPVVDNPPADNPAPKCWYRFLDVRNIGECPIAHEVKNIVHPITSLENYVHYLAHSPVKAFVTAFIAVAFYNNFDNIKAAVGLGDDQADDEAGEAFASTDKCGCEDAQAEEEQPKQEVCEVKKESKKASKKANA